jgi:hypothetical protein
LSEKLRYDDNWIIIIKFAVVGSIDSFGGGGGGVVVEVALGLVAIEMAFKKMNK